MKRVIRGNEDAPKTVSNVHIVESKASIGSGFVTDKTYTGTLSKLLNMLAQKSARYVANYDDRFIVILASSTIAYTRIDECTSTDDFYEAEEWAEDWLSGPPAPASSYTDKIYYASIVDTLRGREIFYDRRIAE